MEHIGIDLRSRTSSICILAADGTLRRELSKDTRALKVWFAELAPSRIVVESCAESRLVALFAMEGGHNVVVVPTCLVRTLGIGKRRIKTDKRDARNLAEASFRLGDQLPCVHMRSDESTKARALLKSRAQLVEMRTAAINFVRSKMRAELLPPMKAKSFCFATKLRSEHPSFAEEPAIGAQVAVLDALQTQLEQLDAELEQLASAEAPQRLQKISGVGPLIAVAFIAAIDDPQRFDSAAQVASYLGLSPGENTTGGKIRRTGIIASGQKQMRSLLIQGAHSMMNTRRTCEPMARWAKELQLVKGRKLAVVALARRLAVVMWAMLRDEARYDPTKTKPDLRHVQHDQAPETVFSDLGSVA